MTTPITKEHELRAFITGFLTDPAHDEYSENSMTAQVFRIALAAMDAVPVAWTDEQELRDVDRSGCGYLFTCNPVTPHADERRVIKLYAAPPAPVVPEIDRKAIADRVYGKYYRIPGATFYNAAEFALDEVDACRAEFLKNCASVKSSTDAGCVTNTRSNCASVKDHQIRELVNELRDIAVEYHGTQQLRERIARTVRAAMLNNQSSNQTSVETVPGDEIKQQTSNCPKCGGRGTYHCPQMLGTVECECTLSAEPVSQPYKLEGGENCWSCGKYFTYEQHSECDGYCPHCNSPVDLDEAVGNSGNSPVIPDGLNIRAVSALREAVRNQWLKSEDFADKVYWKSMHDIANEIVSAMLAAAPQQEGSDG